MNSTTLNVKEEIYTHGVNLYCSQKVKLENDISVKIAKKIESILVFIRDQGEMGL